MYLLTVVVNQPAVGVETFEASLRPRSVVLRPIPAFGSHYDGLPGAATLDEEEKPGERSVSRST